MNVRTLVLFSVVILSLVLGGCIVPLRPVAAVPPAAAPSDPSAPQAAMPDAAAESANATAVVRTNTLSIFDGPSSKSDIVGTLRHSDVVSVTGQMNACTWLQIVTEDGRSGFVSGQPQAVSFSLPCEQIPPGYVRPTTGTLGGSQRAYGYGRLLIENSAGADALVVLSGLDNVPVSAAFIRTGDSFEMMRVPNGEYVLYFTQGDRWDAAARKFTGAGVTYRRFEEPVAFAGTPQVYAQRAVALSPVAGDTASTVDVPPDAFPALSQ